MSIVDSSDSLNHDEAPVKIRSSGASFESLRIPCERCGELITLGPTCVARPEEIVGGKIRFTLTPNPLEIDALNWCPSCRGLEDDPNVRPYLELRRALGVPTGAYFQRVRLALPLKQQRFKGFHLDLFVIRIEPVSDDHPSIPLLVLDLDDETPGDFVIYRRTVSLDDTGASLSIDWHPDHGEFSLAINGWEEHLLKASWGRLLAGVQLLHEGAPKPGRKLGVLDRTLDDYCTEFRAYFACYQKRPTREEFARYLRIRESTIYRNLTGWGLNWGDLKNWDMNAPLVSRKSPS